MADRTTRREFLKFAGVGGTTLGFGTFLTRLPPVTAQRRKNPTAGEADSDEPMVRLIEDTPHRRSSKR
jgi:hypothetical protein